MQKIVQTLALTSVLAFSSAGFAQTYPTTTPTPSNPANAPQASDAPSEADSLNQINEGIYQNNTTMSSGLNGIIQSIQRLTDTVTRLVGAAVDTSAHLMFTLSPDLQTTMSTNYSEQVAAPTVTTATFNTTNIQLNPLFNSVPGETSFKELNHFANLTPLPTGNNNTALTPTALLMMAPFNAGSLLAPDVYSTTAEQTNAENLIGFLSFQSLPYVGLPPGAYTSETLPLQNYRAMLGSYAALESVGLNNLNELYAERQPQNGLGKLAGLTGNTASMQQVEHAMIQQRALNPQWYADMENAPPATINREILYTLTAIQVELYNNNQMMQRMLVTQSAMELMQTQNQIRPQLDQLAASVQSKS